MLTITKFNAWRAKGADNNQQDEENTGILAVGRTLISQWYDDWQTQFGSNNRISLQNENRPYLALLRELDEVENPVESFMLGSHQAAGIFDSHVVRVQSLIAGDISRSTTTRPIVPTIWVWDQNCDLDKPRLYGALDGLSLGKQLSIEEFFELLRKERLPANSPPAPRRVYINNPSGNIIQELILRVPASQAEGLRELLVEYVHNSPQPYFGLRECTTWNTGFSFLFNCPYYVLTTEDAEDHRTISKGNGSTKMRSRESLDFLYLSHYQKGTRRIRDLESGGEARPKYLHDVVSAAAMTGHNDKYWTCIFFNEDLCLEPQSQRLQAENELGEEGGATDPITMTDETGASLKPRTYALLVLVSILKTILTYQHAIDNSFKESLTLFTEELVQDPDPDIGSRQIQQWGKTFNRILKKIIRRNSDLLENFDKFLFKKDVCLGNDGFPHGRLFQSLKRDDTAMKALRELAGLRQRLENVNQRLERQRSAYDDFRRERKDDQVEEGNSRFDQEQKLQQLIKAIAALQIVLTLMSLAAQLFDAWNPSYPVPFIIVVIIIVIICIIALVYFFWRRPVTRRHQDASRSEVNEELGCVGDGRNKQKRS